LAKATLGRFAFGRQLLEGEYGRIDHITERILEQSFRLAAVEPETHFVQIGREMFRGDFVPRAHDAALKQAECGFDGVGMNVSHDVDPATVIDGFVPCPRYPGALHREGIGREIVRDNHVHILADVLSNKLCNRPGFDIACMEQAQFPVTLPNSDNDLLFRVAPRVSPPFGCPAPYVGFVHFDNSRQFVAAAFDHRGTDTVAEIPRGFIPSDAKHSLNLAGRDALFRLGQDVGGDKPFCQRQMRIVEYGSSGDAELCLTLNATEHGFAALDTGDLFLATLRAGSAIGPAEIFEVLATLDFAVETRHKVRKVKRRPNRTNRSHGHAPMKKKRQKTDRQVLKEIFPPEIVAEVDAVIDEVDNPPKRVRENPSGKKPPKPWGRKWTEQKKRLTE
jgi:hypothetical protein